MRESQEFPRLTAATVAVLRALLEEPTREVYGLQLCAMAALPTGTVHPILARLEKMEWLTSEWEQIDARAEGRPRRRYYKLSERGATRARAAIERAETQSAELRARHPGLAGGAA
ncbi:MAG TPA: helix-turn-helix transcriptional regulator [Actinospica sp.]|jgi:DNA-binding MarR family transcriptional regulator|nr:helix-turn-helix transcriptional regulator [Actinospica sp.]